MKNLYDIVESTEEFGSAFRTLGVPRNEMPQVPNNSRGALRRFLNSRDIDIEKCSVCCGDLQPAQKDFIPGKVDKFVGLLNDKKLKGVPLLVSSDNYLLDGHHRWLAHRAVDPKGEIEVFKIGVEANRALMLLHRLPSSKTEDK